MWVPVSSFGLRVWSLGFRVQALTALSDSFGAALDLGSREELSTQECRAEWPTGEIAKFGYFISS